MKRLSVRATWSNVLWSSLRTITRQWPPSPVPGPLTRGLSIVSAMRSGYPRCAGRSAAFVGPAAKAQEEVVGRGGLEDRARVLARAGLDALADRRDEPLLVVADVVDQRGLG